MASEIRVNKIENRSGLGTVTFADTGVDLAGIVTATTFSGSGASLTNLPAANVTGTLPAISGANLTNLPAANLTGALPAISGANLTGIAATDNVRTGILDVAGVSTFRNTMNVGAAVTISESGLEATGVGITVANINGGQIGGRRNLIINGAFQVAQRATSSTTSGYGSVDRFRVQFTGTDESPTHSQANISSGTTPYSLGFRKSLKITNGNQTSGAGADDYIRILHFIESQNVAQSGWNYTSSSSFITLSFWVKSSVAQNFYGFLLTQDGTNYSYPFETGSLSADTWTKVVKTIPGNSNLQFDTNGSNAYDGGLEFQLAPFYGTNKTGSVSLNAWGAFSSSTRFPDFTSTWYTTNDATFEITGVQLEVGSQATPFEHISYGDELLKCQRYYQVAVSESHPGVLAGRGTGSSSVQCSVPLACSLRAVPSLSSSDFTQVYAYLYNARPHNGSSGTVTTTSSQFNPTGAYLTIVVGGFGGQISDDRIVNIGGYATDRKLILDSEI